MRDRTPPTPYEGVDATDGLTRGELSYRARRGDRRAKLTLLQAKRNQETAEGSTSSSASTDNIEAIRAEMQRLHGDGPDAA